MNVAPLTWSLSTSTRSPPELRAGAMKYCLPFAGGWSDVSWICEIALDFFEDVAGRVVRERHVDRVDDRDDLEADEEEHARQQELRGQRAPPEVERVDSRRRQR